MKKNYTSHAILFLSLYISTAMFGQKNNIPNIVFPVNSKPKQGVTTLASTPKNSRVAKSLVQSPKFDIKEGSFFLNLKKQNIALSSIKSNLNSWFNLDEQYSFHFLKEVTDNLGHTHTNYQLLYKGITIENDIIMIHSINGYASVINGNISRIQNLSIESRISSEEAENIAKTYLNVAELIQSYPVEKLILKTEVEDIKLIYKVRIDSYLPFEMCHIFIDAKTGTIIKKLELNAHADVEGTAQTLYSGTQTITCDSDNGNYRLRDNTRKIETYNATNATKLSPAGYSGYSDIINPSTNWPAIPILSSVEITSASQSWWYASFADEKADLYIIIKDALDQTVYISDPKNNINPPNSINNVNIILPNPPYTIEVWDYDAGNSDDFGGSYNLSTSTGSNSWTDSKSSGSYIISNIGNPALDVHWGMEVSYDFYLNILNRDSYDGNGGTIKQFINPPDMQLKNNGNPNNAGAYGPPYNLMVYGLGDGISNTPLVGLDVEGHEYTHMVVNHNGNGGLPYEAESGALNESFADIFGTCIEFYSGVNPDWLLGEDVEVNGPYMRSLIDPKGAHQPDTYKGIYWINTSDLENDHGGVHTNSGVQNYWFYLLCQGGSGTNDLNNSYSVTGIGISDARQIAYRNLITYLTTSASYMDAFKGSLKAAEDLFGNPSTQYTAVREAWYAVGIGNDPNKFCSGDENLTYPSGTITDGSGSANYLNNTSCKWIIEPAGATQITLTFTSFDTEANYDTVFVYDGPDDTYPILGIYWGTTLPNSISTSAGVGAMCIKFNSDVSNESGGWSANYTSTVTAPSCDGGTVLSTPSGSFSDGSGTGNYGNNQLCYWIISPPCATSVSLTFSAFETENSYDNLIIFDDLTATNVIGSYSGSSIPAAITSNTGKMLVAFLSDYSTSMQGFSASYTSTGAAYCSGTTTLNSSDYGTLSDGSGANNYCDNQDCQWLIQPPQANNITINFTEFDLEAASSDGKSIYDAVEIYDGTSTSDSLLGRFSGSNIPRSITSSGGSLLVRFYSDISDNQQGWSLNYTSNQSLYCTGLSTLTSPSGTISDGSGSSQYSNNSFCSWLIQPTDATSITLSFTEFETELDYDGVIIYDGADNTATELGQFSGSSLPSSTTTSGGSLYMEFVSDPTLGEKGWSANYTSMVSTTSVIENNIADDFSIYPNPNRGVFVIKSKIENEIPFEITDLMGKQIYLTNKIKKGENTIDASGLNKGAYIIKLNTGRNYYFEKLIIF